MVLGDENQRAENYSAIPEPASAAFSKGEKVAEPAHALEAYRDICLDALGPLPAEALAAFVALDMGDLDEAEQRMLRVVALTKDSARFMRLFLDGRTA